MQFVLTLLLLLPLPTTPQASQSQAPAQETGQPAPDAKKTGEAEAQEPDLGAGAPTVRSGVTGPLELPYSTRGQLDLRYEGRWTDGARDQDLRAWADVSFGDAKRHLVTGHFSGRGAWDLDRDRSPTHPFRSVDDTYSGDLTGRLYTAYADLNDVEESPVKDVLKRVRLGRQILHETPEVLFFDGVSVRSAPVPSALDLTLSAFVGVPNHLFESSPSGDVTTGAAVEVTPWRGGQMRFDYMHVTDDYLATTAEDDLFGVSGMQRFDNFFVSAHVNILDGDTRELGAHASWTLPEQDLTLTVRYDALLSDQRKQRSIDFDYHTPILATYFAYDQFEAFAHKGFGDHVFVDGGVQVRELREDRNEGIFNHEFRRYYLTPGLVDWPWSGASPTLTLELWESTAGDRFTAAGGDLTQQLDDDWRASAGTFFQLYRYDVLTDQEREDVQVSYARLDYRASELLRLSARFEFEDGDTEDFARLVLGARIDF